MILGTLHENKNSSSGKTPKTYRERPTGNEIRNQGDAVADSRQQT